MEERGQDEIKHGKAAQGSTGDDSGGARQRTTGHMSPVMALPGWRIQASHTVGFAVHHT